MSTFDVIDPVNGQTVTLENRLMTEDIKKGAYFWYDDMSAASYWSCPAVVTRVDERTGEFEFKRLDTHQYCLEKSLEVSQKSSFQRQTMRKVPIAEIKEYLARQAEAKRLEHEEAKANHKAATDALDALDHIITDANT